MVNRRFPALRRRVHDSSLVLLLSAVVLGAPPVLAGAANEPFVNFESAHVRPLALAPGGDLLLAVNTPDNRLAIYEVTPGGLVPAGEVVVGLEPVSVAVRAKSGGLYEAWVVNHLSDSVSIVEIDPTALGAARVVRTLLVGDEPRDVVFAGAARNRAFVTTARRGQNLPASVPPLLTTAGVPRALVWAFDVNDLGSSLTGTPVGIVELFGDTPRALAVSEDGATVYAAVFQSGNRTTTVTGARVARTALTPNGLPPAPVGATPDAPVTGLIVRNSGPQWLDEIGRDWSNAVPFSLPDKDVFLIDADATPPAPVGGTSFVTDVGTMLFNMAVRPGRGTVYVTNTEARNDVRFEPVLSGHLAETRISVIDGTTATPRHLNPHIDYSEPTGDSVEIEQSVAQATELVFSSDGALVYVAAFGSGKVAVLDAEALEDGSIVKQLIEVGDGPSGLVIDESNDRLYVMNRLDHSISVVDLEAATGIGRQPLGFDPMAPALKAARPFLYDARITSGHGDSSCATCHVFGDLDGIAWDLGDPFGAVIPNLIPKNNTPGVARIPFHPMKGPMTTQSLRGMEGAGAMHWRGDRNGTAAVDGTVTPGGDPFDEFAAFLRFNGAFVGLQGRSTEISATDMEQFADFILTLRYPPNPVKALDDADTAAEAAGRALFLTDTIFGGLFPNDGLGQNCNTCHTRPITTSGQMAQAGLTGGQQEIKNPHLRNLYQKVGMFGVAASSIPNSFLNPNSFVPAQVVGDQVRGFGYAHDGAVSTVFDFLSNQTFVFANGASGTTQRRQIEAFLLATDTGLKPIVGQQTTLSHDNAGVAGPRIDLLVARAAAGDCDLVVKGLVDGQQRGFVRAATGTFQSDRAAEALSDAALRALAATPGQPLTYTAVPPGSGVRIGIDRDLDTFYDGDEVAAGSDPADASSFPGQATPTPSPTPTATPGITLSPTATPTATPGPTATPSPTATPIPTPTATPTPSVTPTPTPTASPVAFLTLQTTSLVLADKTTPPDPSRRKIRFVATTKKEPDDHRVVAPSPWSAGDPTLHGATLVVYNSAGSGEAVTIQLPAGRWKKNARIPATYTFVDKTGPISRVVVRADRLQLQGGKAQFAYSLDEAQQGRMAIRLHLGTGIAYCSDAPAKTSGKPPTTARFDRTDLFQAQPKSPYPTTCPAAGSEE